MACIRANIIANPLPHTISETETLEKVKFLKFVLCISFLSISTLIYGQDYTLTVKVVDQSDNSPLDGVTILLDPCKCGGITNTNGIFSKKLKKDSYSLQIDYLGYRSVSINKDLNKNETILISMEVQEEELSEVVLLAQKRFQSTETPQMGVIELNSRELEKIPAALGEFDVLKTLTVGHFFCLVFHREYVIKKGINNNKVKNMRLKKLNLFISLHVLKKNLL